MKKTEAKNKLFLEYIITTKNPRRGHHLRSLDRTLCGMKIDIATIRRIEKPLFVCKKCEKVLETIGERI